MPFGSHSSLADVIQLMCFCNPKSVLDIGIGNGMNGAAVRNYCGFDKTLIGVEAFGKYRNPMWDLYTKVFVQPIEDYLRDVHQLFDLVIMTDVIEHFTKPDGIRLIKKLKTRLPVMGCMLISTPAVWIEQGAAHGNEYERHRSLWTEREFIELGFTIYKDGKPCKYGHRMIVAEYLNK